MAEEVVNLQITEDGLTALLYICSKQLTISTTLLDNYKLLLKAQVINPDISVDKISAIEKDIQAQEFIITHTKLVLSNICKLLDRLYPKDETLQS